MSTFELEYRSYADLSALIHAADISKLKNYDLVVGIPRSGMIPAYMLGLRLNLPVIDLEGFLNGNEPVGGRRLEVSDLSAINNILVVDDSIRFGGQLLKVKEKLQQKPTCNYGFCTPFATTENKHLVD
jgi:adenine/guanine phosphoribosyltransferase-like PRPP-binding protein